MKKLAFLFLMPLLVACGGDNSGPGPLQSTYDAQFNGKAVRLISEPGALTSNGDRLQGTGTSIFRQPLEGMASDAGYEIILELNDGGSVTLVSHAGAELQGGVEIQFTRRGSGRGSLQVSLRANGRTLSTVNRFGIDVFGNMDASRPVWLQVDVHNDEAGAAHLLAWDMSEGIDHFTSANALLDTETDLKSNGSPGKGGGSRWGLILRQSVVRRANQGGGEYHHH